MISHQPLRAPSKAPFPSGLVLCFTPTSILGPCRLAPTMLCIFEVGAAM